MRVYEQETITYDNKTGYEAQNFPLSTSECSDQYYEGLDMMNLDAYDKFSPPGNMTCIDGLDQVSLTGLKNSD